jgi:hypothetical protein
MVGGLFGAAKNLGRSSRPPPPAEISFDQVTSYYHQSAFRPALFGMLPALTARRPPLSDRTVALLLQGLLWLLLTGFYYAWYHRPNFSFVHAWALVLTEVSYGIVLFNSLVYLVIPRWLLRGRWGLALAGGVGLCVLYRLWDFGATLLMAHFLPANSDLVRHMQYYNSPAALKTSFTTFGGLISLLYGPLVSTMFPVIISFLAYALIVNRRQLALESAQFKLELSYVKAQLNPQFLFNTLHHLQYLTRARDPRAGDVVLHLADLLRYTLYETDADRVPLARELEFLEDYLALERLRYPAATIDHAVVGAVAAQHLAPLVLQPFYEQVCAALASAGARLTSAVQIEDQAITLTLSRQLPPIAAGLPYRAAPAIVAAERRLQLQYPGRHTLHVQESGPMLHLTLQLLL